MHELLKDPVKFEKTECHDIPKNPAQKIQNWGKQELSLKVDSYSFFFFVPMPITDSQKFLHAEKTYGGLSRLVLGMCISSR